MKALKIVLPVFGLLIGLVVGCIFLLCRDAGNALAQFCSFWTIGFQNSANFSHIAFLSSVVLLIAIAFVYTYKNAMLNFGLIAQYAVAFYLIALLGCFFTLSWWVYLLIAFFTGGLIGLCQGILKVYLKLNEIASGIIFVLITSLLYLITILFIPSFSESIFKENQIPLFVASICSIPNFDTDLSFLCIFGIVALIAILFFIVLCIKKTQNFEFGGLLFCSKRNRLVTFFISGLLCGLAAGLQYIGGLSFWNNAPLILIGGFTASVSAWIQPFISIFASVAYSDLFFSAFSQGINGVVFYAILSFCWGIIPFVCYHLISILKKKKNKKDIVSTQLTNGDEDNYDEETDEIPTISSILGNEREDD